MAGNGPAGGLVKHNPRNKLLAVYSWLSAAATDDRRCHAMAPRRARAMHRMLCIALVEDQFGAPEVQVA
jgi:hypothetical protein